MTSGEGRRAAIALAVAIREDRILVARRAKEAHLGDCWEFPGGKIEPGEEPEAAARRELAEETGLLAGSVERLAVVEHDYPGRPVRLEAFLIRGARGQVRIDRGREFAWVDLEGLDALDLPPADRPIVRALRERLRR